MFANLCLYDKLLNNGNKHGEHSVNLSMLAAFCELLPPNLCEKCGHFDKRR